MGLKVNRAVSALGAFVVCVALIVGLVSSGSAQQRRRWLDTEGLYYLDGELDGANDIELVITLDRRPIPPKANDPDAPTLPGLHVRGIRFRLRSLKLSSRRVSFRTVTVGGVFYSFDGRVGRKDVDIIQDVPFLAGTLVKRVRGRVIERRKARFGHAVIL